MHLLEVLVSVLHLPLLLGHLLLDLYDLMVGLSQGCFIKLEVIVGHLGLLLNVFILELLKVRAYLAEVVDDGEDLRLRGVELVLQLADGLGGLPLSLYFGVGVESSGGGLTIFDACQGSLIDLSYGLLLILLFGLAMEFELVKLD